MPADKTWPWAKSKFDTATHARFEQVKFKNGVESGATVLANGTFEAGAVIINGYHWVEDANVTGAFDFSSLLNQGSQSTNKLYIQYTYTETDPHATAVFGFASTLPSNAIQLGTITVPASTGTITQGMIDCTDDNRDLSNKYLSEHAIQDYDTRIPTQDEKDALDGGSPSTSNRFATLADLSPGGGDNLGNHTATQDINFANFKGVSCAAPDNPSDVANRQFVLDNVGGQNLASSISQLRKHTQELQLLLSGMTNSPYPDNFGQPFFRTEFEEIGSYVEIDGKQTLQSDHDLTKLTADIITSKRAERGRIDTRLQLPKQYYFGEVIRYNQIPDISNKPHAITYAADDKKIYMITRGDSVDDTILHRINLISLQVEASWFFEENTFTRWNGIAAGITFGAGQLFISEYNTASKAATCIRFRLNALPPQGVRITKSNVGAIESAGFTGGVNGDVFNDIAYDSTLNLLWGMRKTATSNHKLVRLKTDFTENGVLQYDATTVNTSAIDTSIGGIDCDGYFIWFTGDTWTGRMSKAAAVNTQWKSYGKTGICRVTDSTLPSVDGQIFNTDKTDVKMWALATRNTNSLPASASYRPVHAVASITSVDNGTKVVTLQGTDGAAPTFAVNEFKGFHMRVANVYWNIASNTATTVTLGTALDISGLSGVVELGAPRRNFATTITTNGTKMWGYEGGTDNVTATSIGFMFDKDTTIGAVGIELGTVITPGNIVLTVETNNSGAPSGTLVHANATTTILSGDLVAESWNAAAFVNTFSLAKDTLYHVKIVNSATCQTKGHATSFNKFDTQAEALNVRLYNGAKLDVDGISDVATSNNRLYIAYRQSAGTTTVKPDGTAGLDTYIDEANPAVNYSSEQLMKIACNDGSVGTPDTWARNTNCVISANAETYNITGSSNDKLSIKVDGGTAQEITLTAGATRSAANIVTDLAGLTGATASVVIDKVKIVSDTAGGTLEFVTIANHAYTALGFVVGLVEPVARFEHTAVVYDGKMYVFGGYSGGFLNDLWECDLTSFVWTQKTGGATARRNHTAVVNAGKMYIFGGEGGGYLSDLWEYDIAGDSWVQKTGTSMAKNYHTAVVNAGKMYVFGGYSDGVLSNDLWECDLTSFVWTQKTGGATVRYNHTAVVDAGKMYVFSGHGGNGVGYLNDLYECDLTSFVWTQKTSGATVRQGHAAVVNAGKMYVFGGNSGGRLNDLWEYDITYNSWTQKTGGATARFEHTAVVNASKMCVFGGSSSGGALNDLWEYTIAATGGGVSKQRGVFMFDLSSVPANAVSATLSLYLSSADASSKTINLHKLTESPTASQATWNDRITGTAWTTAGGVYESTPVASAVVTNSAGYVEFNITNLYNAWKAGTTQNYGLILRLSDETTTGVYVYITASNGADENKRPKLVVSSNSASSNVGVMTRDKLVSVGYGGSATQAVNVLDDTLILGLSDEVYIMDVSDNTVLQTINNTSFPGVTSTVINDIITRKLVADEYTQKIHNFLVVACNNGVTVINMTTGTSHSIYNYELESNDATCKKVAVADDGKLVIATETGTSGAYQIDIFGDITKIYTSNTNKTWEQQTGSRATLKGPTNSGILPSDGVKAVAVRTTVDNLLGYTGNVLLIANGSSVVEYDVKTEKLEIVDTVSGMTCFDVAYYRDTINAIFSDGSTDGLYKQYDTYLKRLNYSIGKSTSANSRLNFESWNLLKLRILESKVVVITTDTGVEIVDMTYRDTNHFGDAVWYSGLLNDTNGIARATAMIRGIKMPKELMTLASNAAKGAGSISVNFGDLGALVSAGDTIYMYSTSDTSAGNGEKLLVASDYDEASTTIPFAYTALDENIDESSTVLEMVSQAVVDSLPVRGAVKIDSEEMVYNGKSGRNLLIEARGINGTTPAPHNINAAVQTVLRSDYLSGDEVVCVIDKKQVDKILDVRVTESSDGTSFDEGTQVAISDLNTGYYEEAVRSDLQYGQLKLGLKRTNYVGDTILVDSASMYWENY